MCDCSEAWYWRFLRDFGPADDPLEDLKTARFLFVIGGIAFGLGLLPFTVAFCVGALKALGNYAWTVHKATSARTSKKEPVITR